MIERDARHLACRCFDWTSNSTPITTPGRKLINPTIPVIINSTLNTVIMGGVGLTGSVSPVIQNVGLKIRLIMANISNENANSMLGARSKKIARLDFDLTTV